MEMYKDIYLHIYYSSNNNTDASHRAFRFLSTDIKSCLFITVYVRRTHRLTFYAYLIFKGLHCVQSYALLTLAQRYKWHAPKGVSSGASMIDLG